MWSQISKSRLCEFETRSQTVSNLINNKRRQCFWKLVSDINLVAQANKDDIWLWVVDKYFYQLNVLISVSHKTQYFHKSCKGAIFKNPSDFPCMEMQKPHVSNLPYLNLPSNSHCTSPQDKSAFHHHNNMHKMTLWDLQPLLHKL